MPTPTSISSRLPRLSIRSTFRLAAGMAALCAAAAVSAPAQAQGEWPTQPVTILMGFTAGSGVDMVGRALQESLQKSLKTTIIYDYRPGAGGNVASEVVAHARPDGYTLLLGTAATHGINPALYKNLPFDAEADFTPVAPLVDVSNVLTVNPAVIDVKTVKEFIEKVKANPGKYNYASTGNGTGTHLAFAEFNARAGLDMVHVPYKGGPDALQAVLKGEVCCIFNQVQSVLPQYRAGKVRLLGVTTGRRVPVIQDVPTIAESGVAGYNSTIWFGFFGPKGLDPTIARKINDAVKVALETPSIRQKLVDAGNTPRIESVEQFKATVKADRQKWAGVVKTVGASID
ncbi:Bug family tripartite tricarboxylate transporter substrate binding protein [Cupriavidus oxalaticus]|jgi:tripartite-type tricarboxylate transporter receptor subunit TctC|uniref:ABC transporter substrate-binding protein n=1 Tax=Cupriavidus oxalaticus TaxID=96344 RepID=A0A375G7L4_9BURK|nr:tripartite tricarboxylate transporter substrate binding protein [Cupriavidus oxalaticus]QEZ45684.1 tripartite tricarboxylate transporter substrate binding protein [Cupriavidus oxalaticus]QRQ86899.1 tripartite tricarboxylate transporter substrate binding protein [Cupriavidus oxalaticus]QRQ94773.1 tripartite tricarboxylate transporter substrate binding protein [Cupriavidus oxalaticus]WQD83424.1 tripartite tricarboxylate transporter substrate binding protein [Cupriavidus oxalaticus]SPC16249.1 